MKSYLTQEEYEELLINDIMKDENTLILYRNVSHGQLSIARYSGGARINGATYTYIDATDELLREDALKELTRMRKNAKKEPKAEQQSLI